MLKNKSSQLPFLSIIVVTWNNENHIEQALLSCIDKRLQNYEIVVVHNASDDNTGLLIERCVEHCPEIFRVIENEKNEGLGEGRNIGIANAKGEYFIFLDGDDYFETNSLIKIYEKLLEIKPDVLIYDYQRIWDTGTKSVNKLNHLLYEHDASAPEQRKEILKVFNVACNKAYRRDFVISEKFKFPVGYYEDIPWTYKILLKANSIYTIPLVALNYRQRHGSILKSTDERHVILPDRYDELLNVFLEEPNLVTLYGKTMLEIVRAHVFARPVWPRLPKKVRREYLKKSARVLNKWRELNNKKNKDNTLKVAELGIPALYSLGKNIAPIKKSIHNKARKFIQLSYKNILCNLPINKRKVYMECYWGTKLDCNPLALANQLKKDSNYSIVFGYKKESKFEKDPSFDYVRIGSLKYWYTVATSYILVTNTNFRTELIKRADSIHIQTQHGTPLKYMGLDCRETPSDRMNWRNFAKRCRRWDYVISSNPYSSMIWRRAMPYNYTVIESGYPRNDIFFDATQDQIDKIKKELGVDKDKKVILYAPTFRDTQKNSRNIILPVMELSKSLQEDYVLLIRSHHLSKDEKYLFNNIIDVSSYPRTNELCLISDLLITDYSSIMFDFACLKRPIILYMPDYDEYVAKRGMYFDIRKKAPGPIANTKSELKNILLNEHFLSDENKHKLLEFNKEFCPWDDENASSRAWDKILNNKSSN